MISWVTSGDTLMILTGQGLPVSGVDWDTCHSDYNFCGFAKSFQANTTILHWTWSTNENAEERRRLTVTIFIQRIILNIGESRVGTLTLLCVIKYKFCTFKTKYPVAMANTMWNLKWSEDRCWIGKNNGIYMVFFKALS